MCEPTYTIFRTNAQMFTKVQKVGVFDKKHGFSRYFFRATNVRGVGFLCKLAHAMRILICRRFDCKTICLKITTES